MTAYEDALIELHDPPDTYDPPDEIDHDLVAEIADGSRYNRVTEEGMGLFRPLSRGELR